MNTTKLTACFPLFEDFAVSELERCYKKAAGYYEKNQDFGIPWDSNSENSY